MLLLLALARQHNADKYRLMYLSALCGSMVQLSA